MVNHGLWVDPTGLIRCPVQAVPLWGQTGRERAWEVHG